MGMKLVAYIDQTSGFEWLDGTNVGDTFNNFADGEPHNYQGDEQCGVLFTSDGLWRSERCESRYYVCKQKTGQSLNLIFAISNNLTLTTFATT